MSKRHAEAEDGFSDQSEEILDEGGSIVNLASKRRRRGRQSSAKTNASRSSKRKAIRKKRVTPQKPTTQALPRETVPLSTGNGYVEKTSATTAGVYVRQQVNTAVICPCENEQCTALITVGPHGGIGEGSSACVHCGHQRHNGQSSFRGKADIIKHLMTNKCRMARGVERNSITPKRQIGEQMSHEISNLQNRIVLTSCQPPKYLFRCPKCAKTSAWSRRYFHVAKCYPTYGVIFQNNASISKAATHTELTQQREQGEESEGS